MIRSIRRAGATGISGTSTALRRARGNKSAGSTAPPCRRAGRDDATRSTRRAGRIRMTGPCGTRRKPDSTAEEPTQSRRFRRGGTTASWQRIAGPDGGDEPDPGAAPGNGGPPGPPDTGRGKQVARAQGPCGESAPSPIPDLGRGGPPAVVARDQPESAGGAEGQGLVG